MSATSASLSLEGAYTTRTGMRLWQYPIPISKPLSLNDRKHWRKKAAGVAEVRGIAFVWAKHHRLPKGLSRIRVTLIYFPPDRRRRDPENLVATLKPLVDGLVDARIVPDDTYEYLDPVMPRIGEVVKGGRLAVRIEELPPLDQTPVAGLE